MPWNRASSLVKRALPVAILAALGLGLTQPDLSLADPQPANPITVQDEAEFAPEAPAAPEPAPAPELRPEPPESAQALGSGGASWYGPGFAGRKTANGETFDPGKLTAAHRTLPMGSEVRVTDPDSGRSVVVRINDRGPFAGNRVIDLSEAAAKQIGLVDRGHGTVKLELLK